eukprot:COSAG04_NODE_11679_length_694_cov_1.354622_1_plen_190_part_10
MARENGNKAAVSIELAVCAHLTQAMPAVVQLGLGGADDILMDPAVAGLEHGGVALELQSTEAGAAAVDIEAGLRAGTLTAEQAVLLMEQRLEQKMEGRLAEIDAQIDAKITAAQLGGTQLASAVVRRAVARLTEAPTNFHQATVHYLAADAAAVEDAAMARKAPLLYLGSLLIVGLQSTATVAVFMGSIH